MFVAPARALRSYKQERTAVTQALEAAVIEWAGSELIGWTQLYCKVLTGFEFL